MAEVKFHWRVFVLVKAQVSACHLKHSLLIWRIFKPRSLWGSLTWRIHGVVPRCCWLVISNTLLFGATRQHRAVCLSTLLRSCRSRCIRGPTVNGCISRVWSFSFTSFIPRLKRILSIRVWTNMLSSIGFNMFCINIDHMHADCKRWRKVLAVKHSMAQGSISMIPRRCLDLAQELQNERS